LLATAYADRNGNGTVVLLNRTTAPMSVRIEGAPAPYTEIEVVDPYHENARTSITDTDAGSSVLVAPGALVTLTNVSLRELPGDFTWE